ncbi:pyridoxal-phosphate dependent enzyme [Actinomadura geliboluensis]|uniref:Pyridoxal-phosphate dependent enzyme n=1 Tax=Actinomadura geliboluensis TaxID=882440 RepID=A0A5S4HBH4_9ACTN|nr:pyridoxal-phosphate dependent enzyme [Actinomadura geliboluensis]TMR42329.1 pyridoxal-phosphate dependent enzyme [Actinomadura geliboluensis]
MTPAGADAPIDAHDTGLHDVPFPVPGPVVAVKYEAGYASGTHKEPAARAMVAAAAAGGYDHVVVGTCGNYGRAVATAARDAALASTVVLPAEGHDRGAWARAMGARVVFVDGGYEDAVAEARRLSSAPRTVDGNVDGPLADAVLRGHETVVEALARTLGAAPAGLWVPVGNGTTLVAVARGVRRLGWATPIHGVSAAADNAVVSSWPGRYRPLPPDAVRLTEHNEPLVNWDALHGPQALDAVRASGGMVHGVDDDALVTARDFLNAAGLPATAAGAAGVAGVLRHARDHGMQGRHVVLVTGRPVAGDVPG